MPELNLLPHQQRVVSEAVDLDKKLEKLEEFINGDAFLGIPYVEQNLLRDQYFAMLKYRDILNKRILGFAAK